MADLAGESGLSRFQVVRGFKRAFGLAPHAYLLQCRINLTRRLIASGLPLAEAAIASGFADQSHMTRLFARNFGVSPGAFGRATR
nr:helix-turn-helix transcriptional regulator [Novosphingobium sp. Rr 2-17]